MREYDTSCAVTNGHNTDPVVLNARTVKFVLDVGPEDEWDPLTREEKEGNLRDVLSLLDASTLVGLFEAATGGDGYHQNPKFAAGYKLLEQEVLMRGLVTIEEINRLHQRTVALNVTMRDGHFYDMESGELCDEIIKKYSLMKYGGRKEIREFAIALADRFIARLNDPEDTLFSTFESARKQGEFFTIFAPGYRNTESASNMLIQEAAERINVELALRDLPTLIVKKLTRLASNSADYATLSQVERGALPPTTDHILPGKEFYQFPMHILFGDDVRITGATVEAVAQSSRHHGARSFMSLYTLQIDPLIAMHVPNIEDTLNRFLIKGGLDKNVAFVLNQPDFHPVQRLLRLVLHPRNREELQEFLSSKVLDGNLIKLYISALGNDYLKDERYRESVFILKDILINKKLIDERGGMV